MHLMSCKGVNFFKLLELLFVIGTALKVENYQHYRLINNNKILIFDIIKFL